MRWVVWEQHRQHGAGYYETNPDPLGNRSTDPHDTDFLDGSVHFYGV
jgi:hypothetical protein